MLWLVASCYLSWLWNIVCGFCYGLFILSDPHNQEGQIDVDHFNVLLPQLNGDMIH